MASGLIGASVLLLCIWLREGNSQNLLRDQKMKPALLINEVNADNPGEDTMEYLELYHVSGQRVALTGYHLVLYNGKGNKAYKVINLGGFSTDDQGFLLIGSGSLVPRPAVILSKGTIQNGPDAIALYLGRSDLYEGMPVDNKGLADALVHKSNKRDKADELVRVLTPGTEPFLEDPLFRTTDDESLERCQRADSQRFFQVGAPTPGSDNHCIPFSQLNASLVLISEVKLASSAGDSEFVELQGPPSQEVKDLVMVLIEGSTQKIYSVMEVKGETSPDGLLLLGSGLSEIPGGAAHLQSLQNSSTPLLKAGANAIALYSGTIGQFVVGSGVPPISDLLDALVYTTVEQPDSQLVDLLTPEKPPFYVSEQSQQDGGASVSRCVCCSVSRDPSSYALGKRTPLQFNDCPKKRFSQKVSFCFQVADCQEKPQDKSTIQRVLAQSLEQQCNCSFSPAYFKDPVLTCEGRELIFNVLLSARSTEQLNRELQALSVLEKSEELLHFGNQNHSIAIKTCSSNADGTHTPPDLTSEEPRTTEESPALELLINEVNADNPGSREDTEYIELFYPGQAPFSLQNFWLVLYNGKNNLAYQVLNLTGYSTNEWGYFLVGSAGVIPRPSLLLPDTTIQNGVDAVALYRHPNPAYKTNMQVTVDGLVDAVVYRARGMDKAEKLVALLTPGQNVLHENDSHSTEDESISRCLSLKPRDSKSFQVTETTPLGENSCVSLNWNLTKEVLHNSSTVINEVGLANDSLLYKFIELKGKPGDSLKRYTLHFFFGNHSRPYTRIHLQGKFGSEGLFVVKPGPMFQSVKPDEQLVMSALWNHSFPSQENLTVVLFSRKLRLPYGTLNIAEKIEYLVTWNPGMIPQIPFVSGKRERIWSLSYCPFCKETFLISNPTPGMENSCPQESLSLDLGMCLWTPNCSSWLQNPQLQAHLQQILVRSMEDSCLCAISPCALQELNFTCSNTTLKLSGWLLATSPEERQLLIQWQQKFSLSSHLFPVDGIFLRTNAPCASSSEVVPIAKASLEAWEIAFLTLGSILLILLLIGGTFYCIKRPQNYNNIELNDRCEIMSDI